MKTLFEKPIIRIIQFEQKDILTSSDTQSTDESEELPPVGRY